ncbi:MAG: ATP-dependent DNA helicase [Pseudomonadota bacterium]
MPSAADILGPDGPFSRVIDGFAPRDVQRGMAAAVEAAIAGDGKLVVEAGTGTGKTFAYLVPALLSRRKVIVSTGTRSLQDQLFHRDIPRVLQALGVSARVALLKGRSNYLCPYRLQASIEDGRYASREIVSDLQQVARWATATVDGDIAELTRIPEGAAVWPFVTSTADNCLGAECPLVEQCPVMRARKRAQEADLVVVNHHLLFADAALKDNGFGEILPSANAIVLDEAHQVGEVASQFFGRQISSRQITELTRDAVVEAGRGAADQKGVFTAANAVEKGVLDLRLALGEGARRGAWSEVAARRELQQAVDDLATAFDALLRELEIAAPRSQGLQKAYERAQDLQSAFGQLTGTAPGDTVHWFETFQRAFLIRMTPLTVAEPLHALVYGRQAAWIFTSATLAVGEKFDHLLEELGLEDARTLQLASPFDFSRQAALYVPENMPDPASPDYTRAVVEAAIPALEASRGRAFLLFTSHRALQEAARLLEGRLPYPLYVQGTAGRNELLDAFRRHGNAVLLGTGSFWEGIDVRGEALSLVVIDKLPFASPGDPLLQARMDALKRQGRNAFTEYQIPQAVITLKQGAGRLIRDVTDTGVLMLCDPRLLSKGYGRLFLDSLPSMRRTRKLEVVQNFFAALDALADPDTRANPA